jgi:hypothetical protein
MEPTRRRRAMARGSFASVRQTAALFSSKFLMRRPSTGLVALSGFFSCGAIVATVTCLALLVPGSRLEPIWRLNPDAHRAFVSMGVWAVALMLVVAGVCTFAALGIWIRARWGHRLALAVLIVNVLGDATNALIRGDVRTLIGLPIAGALIVYLLSAGVQSQFTDTKGAV